MNIRYNIAKVLFIFFALVATINAFAAGGLLYRAGDPIAGNPKGKVTLVEFFDYQCGHCIDMAPVIGEIIKANPNVRVIFKEFPIRGPVSDYAARAALAANKQGKYYQFSHANIKLAQELKLPGTPVFFVGPTGANTPESSLIGAVSKNEIQDAINKASQL
jgi:protein-disulfide isomerase